MRKTPSLQVRGSGDEISSLISCGQKVLPNGGKPRQHPSFEAAPEIKTALQLIGKELDLLTRDKISEERSLLERRAQLFLWHIPVETIRNLMVIDDEPGPLQMDDEQLPHLVPVRFYVPYDRQLKRDGKLPLLVFFHGGGWTLGSPSVYDSVTRQLARQIPALVLSVDYRLAPENPFPKAVNDAVSVMRWARKHADDLGADTRRIVVSGDSAGGTLATVAAMLDRKCDQAPLALQVLFYPSTNVSSMDYESYREFGTNHLLTKRAVETFRQLYFPKKMEDWERPEASPLLAKDLSGMPPTLIIAAGCDPLRDEGQAYARKLASSGVRVTYQLESRMIHGFLNFYNLEPSCSPYAEATLGYVAGFLRQSLKPDFRI